MECLMCCFKIWQLCKSTYSQLQPENYFEPVRWSTLFCGNWYVIFHARWCSNTVLPQKCEKLNLNSEESVAIKTSSFYRDSGVDILSAVDGIRMMLDDNILKAQAMRGSSYIKAFDTEMQTWETKLISMQDILDAWLEVIIMRICTEVDNNL